MKRIGLGVAIVALLFAVATVFALAYDEPAVAERPHDIVDTAHEAGNFKTLCKAVRAAELLETLKGEGPFTIFAPTDEAFAKLPNGKLDELMAPENKDRLARLLKFHILPGRFMAADFGDFDMKTTVEGSDLEIRAEQGQVFINDAMVTSADIECQNGVIHVIDAVILPED